MRKLTGMATISLRVYDSFGISQKMVIAKSSATSLFNNQF